jgi:hypothetical protein
LRFADLKFPQIHNFSDYKYKLKMFLFKFNDEFWLLREF